jgi:hypothetical protein
MGEIVDMPDNSHRAFLHGICLAKCKIRDQMVYSLRRPIH